MSVKSSWTDLSKELVKLSDLTGVELPGGTQYGPGDEYRRGVQRLEAVTKFLHTVNASLAKEPTSKKPAGKKPTKPEDQA
ncbi:MAG TPA: hypothetical protein VGD99_11310 [Anaerolineae bacterium]